MTESRRVPESQPWPPSISQATGSYHAESTQEEQGKPRRAPGPLPVIPGYEVLGELGRGGMGIVYKARQVALNRLVALKMILAGPGAGETALKRFQAEARAVARLQHPNVVQVYEVGELNGLPYFSLEFVDGGSLAERLKGTPQPASPAATLVEQLARAMHAAHQAGIVHRDLKPGNVLLSGTVEAGPQATTRNAAASATGGSKTLPEVRPAVPALGTPKITDFGLAKQLDAESGQTVSGAIMGTPSYMAPEQASGRIQDIGPPADTYALGAILYEMLTGRPPFRGATVLDTLEQVRHRDPVAPTALQPGVPRDLETICLKCLEKESHRRYASALALADDLKRYLNCEPILARPVGPLERAVKWVKRRPATAAMLTLIFLLFVGGFFGVTSQWLRAQANFEEAEDARARAEDRERKATESEQKEIRARKETEKARGAETIAKNNAIAAQQREAEERIKSDRAAARTSLTTAQARYEHHLFREADEALDLCPPGERGFTWRYLKHRGQGDHLPYLLNDGRPQRVAFHPDGTRLAIAASYSRGNRDTVTTVAVWDLLTGREVFRVQTGADPAQSLAFSNDGKLLAAVRAGRSVQREVALWDAQTGKEVRRLPGHEKNVFALAFSPTGKQLATAGSDGLIKLWDLADGSEIATLTGHQGDVLCLAYSPAGRVLASGGRDGTIKRWSATAGSLIDSFQELVGPVTAVAYGPPDEQNHYSTAMAAGDASGNVWLSNVGRMLAHKGAVTRVAVARGGDAVLSAGEDGTVRAWDVKDAQGSFLIRGHVGRVHDLAMSREGTLIASAGEDGSVKLWDGMGGQSARMLGRYAWKVTALAYRPDSGAVAIGTKDGGLWIVDTQTRTSSPGRRAHEREVSGASFSADGKQLATSGSDGVVKLWDLTDGKVVVSKRITGPHSFKAVAFRPGKGPPLLAYAQLDSVHFWDPVAGKAVGEPVKVRTGYYLAFSPDGKYLAASGGVHFSIIDVERRKVALERVALSQHDSIPAINSLDWSPDSRRVVLNLVPGQGVYSASRGYFNKGIVRVWDVARGEAVLTLREAGQRATFTPDGRQIVSVGITEAKFFDAGSGDELFSVPVENRGVDKVLFSPDGEQMLLAVSNMYLQEEQFSQIPSEVRVYDAPRRQVATTLRQHSSAVLALAYSPDGRELTSAGADGLRVWPAPTGRDDFVGKVLREAHPPRGMLNGIVYHPGTGRALISTSAESSRDEAGVALWDVRQGKELFRLAGAVSLAPDALALSPDGRLAAVVETPDPRRTDSPFRGIKVLDAESGRDVARFDGGKAAGFQVQGLAFHPDGIHIASAALIPGQADQGYGVIVWEARTGKESYRLPRQRTPVFSPDGRWLATLPEDGEVPAIQVWDARTGQPGARWPVLGTGVGHMTFRPDGRCLAATVGGGVLVWDLATKRLLLSHRETRVPVLGEGRYNRNLEYRSLVEAVALAFSPDGRQLAVGLETGAIKVWQVPLVDGPGREPSLSVPPSLGEYLNVTATVAYERGRVRAAALLPSAGAELQSAVETWEALVRDHPTIREYRERLARAQRAAADYYRDVNQSEKSETARRAARDSFKQLGVPEADELTPLQLAQRGSEYSHDARRSGDLELASELCAGVMRLLEPVVQQEPQAELSRELYLDASLGRAACLTELGDPKGALPIFERIAQMTGPDPLVQSGRALALARSGDHARGSAAAEAVLANPQLPAATVYTMARALARAAGAARDDKSLQPAERDRLAQRYGDRSLVVLRRALAGRLFADVIYIDRLSKDRDLDALRTRDDFKAFVAEAARARGNTPKPKGR